MTAILDDGILVGERKIAWSEMRELTLIYYEKHLVRIKFKTDGSTGNVYVGPSVPDLGNIAGQMDPKRVREVHISTSGVFLSAIVLLALLVLMLAFKSLDWVFLTLIVISYFWLWPVRELIDDKSTSAAIAVGLLVFVAIRLVLYIGQ